MYEFELKRIQRLVKSGKFVMTDHAIDEMNEDNLMFADIKNIVATGEIINVRRDERSNEKKYNIAGETLECYQAEIICKVISDVVIITVYVL